MAVRLESTALYRVGSHFHGTHLFLPGASAASFELFQKRTTAPTTTIRVRPSSSLALRWWQHRILRTRKTAPITKKAAYLQPTRISDSSSIMTSPSTRPAACSDRTILMLWSISGHRALTSTTCTAEGPTTSRTYTETGAPSYLAHLSPDLRSARSCAP